MGLKLYKKDTSSPCRAVYMVLEALNIKDVEYVNMNLLEKDHLKEDYLKLNPQHTIPTLVDGEFVIWDSHAICTYLINKYAKDDALYPKDPERRALVDQRLHFDSSVLFAALKETMVPLIYLGAKSYNPESLAKIKTAYEFLEKFLTGPWLVGDTVTVADICIGSTMSSLNEVVPIDASLYPKLAAWFARCSEQEFYEKANTPGVKAFRELVKSLSA